MKCFMKNVVIAFCLVANLFISTRPANADTRSPSDIVTLSLRLDEHGVVTVKGSEPSTKWPKFKQIERVIKACAERAKSRGERIDGQVVVAVTARTNGAVSFTIQSSTFGPKTLLPPCIEARIKPFSVSEPAKSIAN